MSGDGGIQRRAAVRRLGWGSVLPLAALGAPLGRVRAGRREIAVPAGAFRLERILTRELSDGAAIVVTRHWRIGFARADGGIVVSGEQTFADVDAPAVLAPLASIERSRSASNLFPLTIDDGGQIRGSSQGENGDAVVRALETGRTLINSLPLGEAERLDARNFMTHLSTLSANAVSRLPSDLFFPRPGEHQTTRDIALPSGESGSIAVTARASVAPDTGLLVSIERRVVTRIEASERITAERWTLTSI